MTRDLNECAGRYRKRSSLRGMKQERIFWVKAEMFVRNVVFLGHGSKDKDAPVVAKDVCGFLVKDSGRVVKDNTVKKSLSYFFPVQKHRNIKLSALKQEKPYTFRLLPVRVFFPLHTAKNHPYYSQN